MKEKPFVKYYFVRDLKDLLRQNRLGTPGTTPAENARQRSPNRWLIMNSAMILRAELPVQMTSAF